MPADRPPSPGPLIAARTIALVQTAIGLVGAVLGGLAAVASAASDRAADAADAAAARSYGPSYGGGYEGWRGFATGVFTAAAVAGVVTVVLIGVPLLVLRGRTPTRRVTGRGLLMAGELLLAVPFGVVVYIRYGFVRAGTDPVSLVVDTLVVVPLVVVACLLAPSVGRWARGAPQPVT